jgi:hypothetical protein
MRYTEVPSIAEASKGWCYDLLRQPGVEFSMQNVAKRRFLRYL